jgi:transcriptional regulator with XRE-family HTH domain
VSSAVDGRAGLAEELRRRRTALGWTLEQVAAQAQVSVGMLSLIETGKRRPSLRSWERIRGALGISEPLPEEAWRQQPREISVAAAARGGDARGSQGEDGSTGRLPTCELNRQEARHALAQAVVHRCRGDVYNPASLTVAF